MTWTRSLKRHLNASVHLNNRGFVTFFMMEIFLTTQTLEILKYPWLGKNWNRSYHRFFSNELESVKVYLTLLVNCLRSSRECRRLNLNIYWCEFFYPRLTLNVMLWLNLENDFRPFYTNKHLLTRTLVDGLCEDHRS